MPDARAGRLANLLGAASLGLADHIREAVELASGMSDAAPAALVCLHEAPGERTIEELRLMVGLTHSGGVRLVDRLSEAGYVTRRPRPPGRSVVVILTAEGAAAANRVRQARADAINRVARCLSPEHIEQLADSLSTLIVALTQERLARRAAGVAPPGGALCRLCDFTACGRPAGQCPAQAAAHVE